MKPIVEKVLKSGIIDKGMIELLEKWGNLPEGSVELLNNGTLKDATKEQLHKFAEDLANEVAKEHILREAQLDVENIRWSTKATIRPGFGKIPGPPTGIYDIPAVVDRMNRLYFRVQDAELSWFVPGYNLYRSIFDKESRSHIPVAEVIVEAQILYSGDQPTAIQVLTGKAPWSLDT